MSDEMFEFNAYNDFTVEEDSPYRFRGVVLLHEQPILWTLRAFKTEEIAIKNAKRHLITALECSHSFKSDDEPEQDQDHKGDTIYYLVSECTNCGLRTYSECDFYGELL